MRRSGTVFGIAVLLLVCAVAACAVRSAPRRTVDRAGTSELEILPPEPPEPPPPGFKPREHRPERPAEALRQRTPRYPESVARFRVDCVARILYHIETDGTATLVRLAWDEPPPAEHAPAFEDAIRAAVADWMFAPAVLFVRQETADGAVRFVERPIPKGEKAIVRFRVVRGRPRVEAVPAP